MASTAQRMARGLAAALIGAALAGSLAAPAAAGAGPPAPQPVGGPQAGAPGTIYYGATPPGGGGALPVLVFVQGLHGQANTWWTNGNDMYSDAYYAGFRTAFVDLTDAGGTGGSIWTNGQMLAGQLASITTHYGVSSVNVVAHSKGGLDSNAAIVHYGAAPRVQTLYQLASPNAGSQLADLSYSWWAWWLAAILGQRDDAVYSLQTGQMSLFRSLSDGRPENAYVHYDTSAGTSHGGLFGALWWGGSYLQTWGANDGAVTLSSAHHPLGTHMFTDSGLDHDQMPVGHNTWSRIASAVNHFWRGAGAGPAAEPAPADPYAALPADALIRGGAVNGVAVERFPVEDGAASLRLVALTNPGARVTLRGPDGAVYTPAATGPGDPTAPLGGATQHLFSMAAPAAGVWQAEIRAAPALSLGGATAGAYLLIAQPDSPLRVTLTRPSGPTTFARGARAAFTLQAADGAPLRDLQVEARLGDAPAPLPSTLSAGDTLSLLLPGAPGVYNLSLTVRGQTGRGLPFERSLTTSFAAGGAPVTGP